MIRSRNLTRVLFAACGLLFSGILALASPPLNRDRAAFVRKLSSLSLNATDKQVLAALGKPDDIMTPLELNDANPYYDHVWAYGTDGHLTLPTLGCVYMQKHRVLITSCHPGKQPPPGMFTEAELRRLFKLIDESRTRYAPDGHPANPASISDEASSACTPRTIINIVNALLPLGKTRILAALDAYCEVVGNENVFLILRALFDVPGDPGYMPRMMVGAPFPSEPNDHKAVPRFPLLIVDDVPLTVVDGYSLAGYPEQPASEVDYFRAHGTLRSRPLQPKGDPLAIPGIVAAMPVWSEPQWDYHHKPRPTDQVQWELSERMRLIMEQVMAMLGSQTRVADWDGPTEALLKRWGEATADLAGKKLRWNAKTQRYTTPSGDYLPEPSYVRYQLVQWKPPVRGGDLTLSMLRTDGKSITIQAALNIKGKAAPIDIYFYTASGRRLPAILAFDTAKNDELSGHASKYESSGIRLDSGTAIYMEVIQSKTTRRSPVSVP